MSEEFAQPLVEWFLVPEAARSTRRVGLFGGTFDPPHVGHLVTAVNVRHALDLDLVVLMVANVPWQKEGTRRITPAADRLAMVEAAVADVPGLVPGRTEIDHGGNSYTADTLASLAAQYPGAEIFTIVGDDAAAGLRTWTAPTRSSPSRPSWSSTARVTRSSCPTTSRGSASRCRASRCRAPTCGRVSPMAGRSTTW